MTEARVFSVILTACLLAACSAPSVDETRSAPGDAFADALVALEAEIEGDIGAFVLDTASGETLGYRADQRFAMASTFKPLLVAAVLAEIDGGRLALDDRIGVRGVEIQPHSPVTGQLADGQTLTVAELCDAAITISDNTATNLLLDVIGGPERLTAFLRAHGDEVTRLDRYEVALNTNHRGDPRDTSSPRAIVHSYRTMLDTAALSDASRIRLREWLMASETGRNRLRAGLPAHWQLGDKTGYGANGAVNNVAIAWPPGGEPVFIAVLMSWTDADVSTLNTVHTRIARLAIDLLPRDPGS